MRKFFQEFKEFISKGSVMDMAVGIIIGGAFTGIVTSLVDDIISPLLGLIGGANFDSLAVEIGGVTLTYGKFITAVINFLLIALVLFCVIKGLNKAKSAAEAAAAKLLKEEKKKEEATEKDCPYCLSKIPVKATRCPHCTSVLEETK